ncbi:sulfite exporter TauE/SafE family protein [Microbulbifer donghaiensis]|uniref:sulfite exporter TauE/SafE family protein n=1 Tax=Microbulbifer donghaiensis TaxID=494016 RepID=UPI001356481A|nr:sulfite exporter TauE/SafE family protein [Microbulbifer donghaiensis]
MESQLASPLFWLLALIGVTLTGISKSGFAGGAGVVAVPLLALVMPVPLAVLLMLPLLLAMDIKTIQYYRQHTSTAELKKIVPAALAGIAAGGLLLGKLPVESLKVLLGGLSIVFALWHRLAPILGQMKGAAWLWGGISGLTSTLIHAGGPPINIYLIAQRLPKLTWLASAGVFFGVMNAVKVFPYLMTGHWTRELLALSLALLPVAIFGTWLGRQIQGRISEQQFVLCCRLLLLVSGLLLIAQVIAGSR